MLASLTHLETITYRAALALQFFDSATGQAVTNGLRVRAWAFDPAAPRPARRVDEAEKSPTGGVYGFRSLPGLGGYQMGEDVAAGSLAFLVYIEDGLGRFLPQTRRYDLPLALAAVQQVTLFSSAGRPIPTGYAAIRVQLVRTTAPAGAPPAVTVVEPARWARVTLSVPPGSAGAPAGIFHGQADSRGAALILAPYPLIAAGVLLDEAEWVITVEVAHAPAALAADATLLQRLLPELAQDELARQRFPPLQTTVEAQPTAVLFGTVTVVDAQAQVYAVVGSPNVTQLDFDLSFGRALTLRTQVDGDAGHPLSELLIQSA